MKLSKRQEKLTDKSQQTIDALKAFINSDQKLCVIKAPPGSGKTFTLLTALQAAPDDLHIAVAAQTNAQCDDICDRFVEMYPKKRVVRFTRSGVDRPETLDHRIDWISSANDLSEDHRVVVGTTSKWSLINESPEFDLLIVDEAWQMSWADFMLLGRVSARFILIGDPGQIPPVVTIDTRRWETSPRAPHRAAPEVILGDSSIDFTLLELTSCRRLPAASVDLVRPFYDFTFDAFADDGVRGVAVHGNASTHFDEILATLHEQTEVLVTIPTPEYGPPVDCDLDIARLAARLAVEFLNAECHAISDDGPKSAKKEITADDIGIVATHRVMNAAINGFLPAHLRFDGASKGIRVDTPERWQGLERVIMIAVHPLSGVVNPSEFDLETGRLCVMASRHRSALVVISRDHVATTLDSHIPSAEQAIGRPDVVGRGHQQHSTFWAALADKEIRLEVVPS